jgi:hypothetical protein
MLSMGCGLRFDGGGYGPGAADCALLRHLPAGIISTAAHDVDVPAGSPAALTGPLVREVTSSWIALAPMRDKVIHGHRRRDSSDG